MRAQGRYEMASEGSGFAYVRDRQTGRWVSRACELRVAAARDLPQPLSDDEHGDKLSVQLFRPVSVESAGLQSIEPEVRDGHRVWRLSEILDESDLAGEVAYGIQVEWPQPGAETRVDPLEIIRLPPPGDTPPEQWSEWMSASDLREGAFGWWDEVHGAPPESLPGPQHPFQLRCRLLLNDTPGVP